MFITVPTPDGAAANTMVQPTVFGSHPRRLRFSAAIWPTHRQNTPSKDGYPAEHNRRLSPHGCYQIICSIRNRQFVCSLFFYFININSLIYNGALMENTIRGTKPVPNHLWRPRHVLCCTFLIHSLQPESSDRKRACPGCRAATQSVGDR